MSSTDRIERSIMLQAPVERVWRALSNAEEFGRWFGVTLKGQVMKPGSSLRGNVTYAQYEHLIFTAVIERMEPNRFLSWRWHPAAVDVHADYSAEPTTLVEFELQAARGGTLLTVVESGFDALPAHRRLDAFRMNSNGRDTQMSAIEKHVAAG